MPFWRRDTTKRDTPVADAGAARRESALVEFSRQLVGAGGVGEIAQALFRTIDDLFEVDRCALLAVDEEQTRALGVAAMGMMDAGVGSINVDLVEDTSAVALVVRDRAPHRVLDGQRESLHNRQIAAALGIRSALYVPLQTSGGVIGVAVIGMSHGLKAFRRDEVDLVQKLANDAAVAIERARFAQALREVGERELIVASVARAVRESLDPQQVLCTAASELGEQTDADDVRVWLVPGSELDARLCTWTSAGTELVGYDDGQLAGSARLALTDRHSVAASAATDAPASTEISLPLVQRERTLGVLSIRRPHAAFDAPEIRLVELIAVEIAAALEHVRLYQAGRKHLDEQLALARAAQQLTADLRFDRVLEHIVNEVVKLLRTSSAAFYTYERDEQMLTLRAAFGEVEQQAVGERMGMTGLAGRVVRSGVSQYTNDYQDDLSGQIHPVFRGVTRAISAPVRWQGDLRGVISVAARDATGRFGEHDVALLEAFADLASLALHNADAYSAHSRQARIQAGFYRISQVLSSSLSRPATLAALAQAATEALDGSWSLVIGGDGSEDDLHVEGSYLAPDGLLEGLRTADAFAQSPVSLAIDHRRVVTSRNLLSDDRVAAGWRTTFGKTGVVSQICVPVAVHGRHSAVVVVNFDRDVKFGDEELVVSGNLASAASAALERAGLFENERRTRRLSEVLADVSALLAETLKSQTVLERIVEQAAVLLEVDACSLAVSVGAQDDDHGTPHERIELRVHSSAGPDAALVAMLRGSTPSGLVEEVARTKRSVSVEELASESGAQVLEGEQYDSFLGVPLRHPRGHLIGVLSAYTRRHRAWSDAEIASLESFASSAAIAIRNAELYANVKRERDTIEKLLASIAEGIVATDAGGNVTLWNQAAEQITGLPHEQVVGRPWRDVLGLSADTVVEDGQSVIEARPSGAPMWLSVTASRLKETAAQDAGAIYAFRDVSAHYTLDKLKSDFVSTVSYVLRTPLTSIYGFAQTLLRDDMDFDEADRKVFLQYIASETERLTDIVDDLLEVARIDAGSVEVHVEDCDVTGLIADVTKRARSRRPAREIRVEAGNDLRVRADADKLETVLANLVDNAVRFSPEGGDVRVEADRENGAVRIRVIDSGVGIAPGEQKHLFTKFYVSPQSSEIAGSGLGLYISKGLVSAMGGRIWVSSQPGSGSTFTVELPVANEGATYV